ncbi:hypothetical protein V8E36_005518 [Tilletia maclaganii]
MCNKVSSFTVCPSYKKFTGEKKWRIDHCGTTYCGTLDHLEEDVEDSSLCIACGIAENQRGRAEDEEDVEEDEEREESGNEADDEDDGDDEELEEEECRDEGNESVTHRIQDMQTTYRLAALQADAPAHAVDVKPASSCHERTGMEKHDLDECHDLECDTVYEHEEDDDILDDEISHSDKPATAAVPSRGPPISIFVPVHSSVQVALAAITQKK